MLNCSYILTITTDIKSSFSLLTGNEAPQDALLSTESIEVRPLVPKGILSDVYKRQDYSGWRCLDGSSSTLPLWIEAFDPSHGRKFIFTQKGPALQTTILYADGTEKQRIYRRKEDMATELMAMFQEELRVYPPWSEDRRKRYEY